MIRNNACQAFLGPEGHAGFFFPERRNTVSSDASNLFASRRAEMKFAKGVGKKRFHNCTMFTTCLFQLFLQLQFFLLPLRYFQAPLASAESVRDMFCGDLMCIDLRRDVSAEKAKRKFERKYFHYEQSSEVN